MNDLTISATERVLQRLSNGFSVLKISEDDYTFFDVQPKKRTIRGNTSIRFKNKVSGRLRGFSYDRTDLSKAIETPPTGIPLGLETLPARTPGLIEGLSMALGVQLSATDIVDEPVVQNYVRVKFTNSCLLFVGNVPVNITG